MQRNNNVVRMDIRSAVNYTESTIAHGTGAFFIDCEFGIICVETNPFTDMNPIHPCIVTPWKEAPDTKFAAAQSSKNADWYCGIDIYNSAITDHITIIEGFTRCMFMNLGINSIDEAIIDAAIFTFVDHYDPYSINLNMIEREFRKNHLKGGSKRDKAVQAIVREFFQRKIEMASKSAVKANERLTQYLAGDKMREHAFYDPYCRDLFGIILYANSEAKANSNRSYNLLIDYSDESNVDRSMSAYKEFIEEG